MPTTGYSASARARAARALKSFARTGANPHDPESWPRFMDQETASPFLEIVCGIRIAPKSLQKRRVVRGGPGYQKFGHKVSYPRDRLEAWAEEQRGPLVETTSQAA